MLHNIFAQTPSRSVWEACIFEHAVKHIVSEQIHMRRCVSCRCTLLFGNAQVIAGNDTTSHVSMTGGVVLETYPSTSLMLDISRDKMKWAMFIDNNIHPLLLVAVGMMGMKGNCDAVLANTTLLQRIKVRERAFLYSR
jgi:hypothetical protein